MSISDERKEEMPASASPVTKVADFESVITIETLFDRVRHHITLLIELEESSNEKIPEKQIEDCFEQEEGQIQQEIKELLSRNCPNRLMANKRNKQVAALRILLKKIQQKKEIRDKQIKEENKRICTINTVLNETPQDKKKLFALFYSFICEDIKSIKKTYRHNQLRKLSEAQAYLLQKLDDASKILTVDQVQTISLEDVQKNLEAYLPDSGTAPNAYEYVFRDFKHFLQEECSQISEDDFSEKYKRFQALVADCLTLSEEEPASLVDQYFLVFLDDMRQKIEDEFSKKDDYIQTVLSVLETKNFEDEQKDESREPVLRELEEKIRDFYGVYRFVNITDDPSTPVPTNTIQCAFQEANITLTYNNKSIDISLASLQETNPFISHLPGNICQLNRIRHDVFKVIFQQQKSEPDKALTLKSRYSGAEIFLDIAESTIKIADASDNNHRPSLIRQFFNGYFYNGPHHSDVPKFMRKIWRWCANDKFQQDELKAKDKLVNSTIAMLQTYACIDIEIVKGLKSRLEQVLEKTDGACQDKQRMENLVADCYDIFFRIRFNQYKNFSIRIQALYQHISDFYLADMSPDEKTTADRTLRKLFEVFAAGSAKEYLRGKSKFDNLLSFDDFLSRDNPDSVHVTVDDLVHELKSLGVNTGKLLVDLDSYITPTLSEEKAKVDQAIASVAIKTNEFARAMALPVQWEPNLGMNMTDLVATALTDDDTFQAKERDVPSLATLQERQAESYTHTYVVKDGCRIKISMQDGMLRLAATSATGLAIGEACIGYASLVDFFKANNLTAGYLLQPLPIFSAMCSMVTNYALFKGDVYSLLERIESGTFFKDAEGQPLGTFRKGLVTGAAFAATSTGVVNGVLVFQDAHKKITMPLASKIWSVKLFVHIVAFVLACIPGVSVLIGLGALLFKACVNLVANTNWKDIKGYFMRQFVVPFSELTAKELCGAILRGLFDFIVKMASILIAIAYSIITFAVFKHPLFMLLMKIPKVKEIFDTIIANIVSGLNALLFLVFNVPNMLSISSMFTPRALMKGLIKLIPLVILALPASIINKVCFAACWLWDKLYWVVGANRNKQSKFVKAFLNGTPLQWKWLKAAKKFLSRWSKKIDAYVDSVVRGKSYSRLEDIELLPVTTPSKKGTQASLSREPCKQQKPKSASSTEREVKSASMHEGSYNAIQKELSEYNEVARTLGYVCVIGNTAGQGALGMGGAGYPCSHPITNGSRPVSGLYLGIPSFTMNFHAIKNLFEQGSIDVGSNVFIVAWTTEEIPPCLDDHKIYAKVIESGTSENSPLVMYIAKGMTKPGYIHDQEQVSKIQRYLSHPDEKQDFFIIMPEQPIAPRHHASPTARFARLFTPEREVTAPNMPVTSHIASSMHP